MLSTSQAQSRFTFCYPSDSLISLSSALNLLVDEKDHWTVENADKIELGLASFVHLIHSDPFLRWEDGTVREEWMHFIFLYIVWATELQTVKWKYKQTCQWHQYVASFSHHSVSYQKGNLQVRSEKFSLIKMPMLKWIPILNSIYWVKCCAVWL